jgi:hypothetical protein
MQCYGSGMFIPDHGSEFFPSPIPDSGSKRFQDPGSGSASKNLSILIQNNVSKLSEIRWGCSSWILIFTHAGSRNQGQKGNGPRTRIRDTETKLLFSRKDTIGKAIVKYVKHIQYFLYKKRITCFLKEFL